MGTRHGNKLTPDVAVDSISLDSLSFADLVSIQGQPPKSPPKQIRMQDPEFEFSSTRSNSHSSANLIKITPADLLISNGQLQPQAHAFQSNQSLTTNAPSSIGSLLETRSSNKRSSGQSGTTKQYDEHLHKARKQANKESTVSSTWFGQKVFKSFVSPCRECHAIKPDAVKAQTVPGENVKI